MASSKPPQILQLTPATEIIFEGPFDTQVVTSYLELRNPSDERVCFKVKTTAPRRYCVRPNSGIVEPNSKIKIAIMLQPIDQDSQSERNKHKFMVQSAIIHDENKTINLEQLWQTKTPDEIMDSKLRCVFQSPTSTAPSDAAATTNQQTASSDAANTPDLIATNKSSTTTTASTKAAASTNQQTHQQQMTQISQKLQQATSASGDGRDLRSRESAMPSQAAATAAASSSFSSRTATTTTTSKPWGSSSNQQQSPRKSDVHDKSVASSHNLTASFLQPMSDDYKMVLVSLAMLFFGVILGKYII